MRKVILAIIFGAIFLSGCATSNQHLLEIDSTPPDALISVHKTKDISSDNTRTVAGTTPIEKNFDFPKENHLWLELEKRGYITQILEVTPETKVLSVKLERMKDKKGENIKEYTFPKIQRLLLVRPDVNVIHRGFSKEEVAENETETARNELTKGIHNFFSGRYEVATMKSSQDDEQLVKSVWRDARAAMDSVDPIRLKYLAENPRLETKSSRGAARQLGLRYGAETMLLLMGKQNLETAGMVLGKVGLSTARTMASYGSAYSNAVARGDSFFVYTIYTPSFVEGTLLKAVLIECSSGDILWANKGLWGAIRFNDPDEVKKIITDILAGLP